MSEAPILHRDIAPQRGPRFWRENGEIMFSFVIDPGNIIGPRMAQKSDSAQHPDAWSEFVSGDVRPALVEVVPDAREFEEPAAPLTSVAEKDMSGFEARLAPAQPKPKRKYTRRKAVG